MAQEIINLSTANDRKGDDLRSGGTKINNNFAQLFAETAVFISQESDFPTQTATEITLESKTVYIVTKAFSTAKNFISVTGASITARNIDGRRVTFTGTGAMFSGTDNGLFIHDIPIDPGSSAEAFNFEDTIGGLQRFISFNVAIISCAKVGTMENLLVSDFFNTVAQDTAQGLEYKGTSITITTVTECAMTSTSATFKAIDLGTSISVATEVDNLFVSAPAGAFGISGLANNGNIPSSSGLLVGTPIFL